MADYYSSYSAQLKCPHDVGMKLYAKLLAKSQQIQKELNDEYEGQLPTHLEVSESGMWLADEFNSLPEWIAEEIHEFFKSNYPEGELLVYGSSTCSRLRIDEFGGWGCAITKDFVRWVDLHTEVRKALE